MELMTLYKRVVGLDVHQAKITACSIIEDDAGNVSVELAEFGGFKRDRKAMAQWVADHRPEMVVMESTGIYWKSPYAALEGVGIVATVAKYLSRNKLYKFKPMAGWCSSIHHETRSVLCELYRVHHQSRVCLSRRCWYPSPPQFLGLLVWWWQQSN